MAYQYHMIDDLLDLLEDPNTPVETSSHVREEIKRRSTMLNTVEELRRGGWYSIAHAIEVVFAGAQPDFELLRVPVPPNSLLCEAIVEIARSRAR